MHDIEKFQRRTREIETLRFMEMQPIAPFTAMDGALEADQVYTTIPQKVEGFTVELGHRFTGLDSYLWLQKTITLPPMREDCDLVALFDFGKTGGGHNSGFESLLFIDGQPYQGVDSNHHDVVLNDYAGQTIQLTFMLWTGLRGGPSQEPFTHIIAQAEVGYLLHAADEYYYLCKAIYKTLQLLPDTHPDKADLIAAVNRSLQPISFDLDKFHATIPQALAVLNQELSAMEKQSKITINCVGHTHIDVAWLWRLKHTREKAGRSFATVLRLMDEFDEYVFLQTQPQLYKYLKSDFPQLYEQLRQRVAQGSWEADGGMWLEADCNVTSGESLARQLQHGIDFIQAEFGRSCRYLWLPDVFGYSWALPQLLRQCHIDTFMTTKISWNQYNSIPNDLFSWRGIDGTEVLTYFITTPDVGRSIDDRFSTYNGMLSPRSVLGSWEKFKNKELSKETLIAYGFGDGGGGVNRNMLKMRRAMDRLPGLPNVKTTRADAFFDRIHQRVNQKKDLLQCWDGELYLEYHRGTYTTQAHNKLMNRRMENKLLETEWLSALEFLHSGSCNSEAIYLGWETLLRNQFHDIIPGSSIAPVYADSRIEYDQLSDSLDAVQAHTFGTLLRQEDNAWTAFSFSSFARSEAVFVPETRAGSFADDQGNALSAVREQAGYRVLLNLAPLSGTAVRFVPGGQETGPVAAISVVGNTAETPYYTITWDEDGHLVSLFDKENARQVLCPNQPANLLEVYEDKPLNFDAWDIDIYYTQKKELFRLSAPAAVISVDGMQAVVRFTYTYNLSTLVQDMVLYSHSRRIDFQTQVEWQENQRLLKAAFPVDVRSTRASYDIQYGHVERPTHFNTSWDYARFEVVGHKWADLSDSSYGVSLLNDCKYGYNTKDNVLRLSLLRSSTNPDANADRGSHRFTYSLLPHAGTVTQGDTIQQSHALNLPVVVRPGLLTLQSPLELQGEGFVVDACKKAEHEDCLILRIHECRGTHQSISIACRGMKGYCLSNPLEETMGETSTASVITDCLHAFELKTYKIWLQ